MLGTFPKHSKLVLIDQQSRLKLLYLLADCLPPGVRSVSSSSERCCLELMLYGLPLVGDVAIANTAVTSSPSMNACSTGGHGICDVKITKISTTLFLKSYHMFWMKELHRGEEAAGASDRIDRGH